VKTGRLCIYSALPVSAVYSVAGFVVLVVVLAAVVAAQHDPTFFSMGA